MTNAPLPLGTPLAHAPAPTRAGLLAIAEYLSQVVAPQIEGSAASRVSECSFMLVRLAQEIAPSDETLHALKALQDPASPPEALPRLEEAVLAAADRDTDVILERLRQKPSAPKVFDGPGFERYLQAHDLGGHKAQVDEIRQLAGGRSKITTLIRQHGARHLPDDLVVRQDWAGGGVQGTTVVSEFALLNLVHAAGLAVPKPYLVEPSSILGAPFVVMSRVSGVQKGSYFLPPSSREMVLDLAEQLARMHRLPVDPLRAAGVPNGPRSLGEMRSALDVFCETQHRFGVPSPSVHRAIDWLERHCDRLDSDAIALVHNDIGAHNLMIDGESLTGILDWELAGIDHPALDLGYAREWIVKVIPWNDFLTRYREAGGPSLDPFDIDFYTLWSAVRLYCLVINARAAVTAGHIRDMEVVQTAFDAIPWLVRRICRELNHIILRYAA